MNLPINIRDDVSAPAFDLRARLEQTTVETVVTEALENIKAQMMFSPNDRVTRCVAEAVVRDMLGHLLNMRVVHTITAAMFSDYSIRSLPKGAARVTFTGKRLIGSGIDLSFWFALQQRAADVTRYFVETRMLSPTAARFFWAESRNCVLHLTFPMSAINGAHDQSFEVEVFMDKGDLRIYMDETIAGRIDEVVSLDWILMG